MKVRIVEASILVSLEDVETFVDPHQRFLQLELRKWWKHHKTVFIKRNRSVRIVKGMLLKDIITYRVLA